MQTRSKTLRPDIRITWYLFLCVAVVFGFVFHEAAHWLTGELLGNDMQMSIGKAWPVEGRYLAPVHGPIISAAGPIFTILVAAFGMFAAIGHRALWGYALVYSSFMFRALAFGVSFLNPNDEARISLYLGLPWFVLPAFVTAGLLYMTLATSRALGIKWRTNVAGYFTISAMVTALIILDGQFPSAGV